MERHPASQRRDADVAFMRRAVGNAWDSRTVARPNPWVGAVVVCADGSVFDGSTSAPGGAHAEINAMNAARDAGCSLDGATLYSTLEPCSHHGRTGPCSDAVSASGVNRVVIGVIDPDPKVAGRGVARLREAGLDVEVGVCAEEIADQLAPYLHQRRTGRPMVVLKMATTLDSRTVAPAGQRWITGETARRRVHELRAQSDAVVVGSGTVRADDPELTVRHVDGPSPRRVVLSGNGRVDSSARINPCTVWTGGLEPLLDSLGRDGALQVLVEGGPTVAAAFHRAGLIDRYVFHVAPVVSGEAGAPGVFGPAGAGDPDVLLDTTLVSVTVLGDDLELVLEPLKETTA